MSAVGECLISSISDIETTAFEFSLRVEMREISLVTAPTDSCYYGLFYLESSSPGHNEKINDVRRDMRCSESYRVWRLLRSGQ